MSARRAALVIALVGAAGPAAAQVSDALYTRWSGLSGWELRGYSFSGNLGLNSISQWDVPVVTVAPFGRTSLDLTTHFVSAHISGAGDESLSGFSDTQLRLLYAMPGGRAVGSLALNLPTGLHTVSTSQFEVSGAVGSNYLSFPVYNLGTAFGLTGGLAYAAAAGPWNVGVSGSLRYLASYQPFSDQSVSYSPGVEVRVRAGGDRLLGDRSRLLLGVTASTFSTDQFNGTATVTSATYKPGVRLITDAGFVHAFEHATLTVAAWDYLRLAGDVNDTTSQSTKENVANLEVRFARPLSPAVTLEPLVAFRQWNPAGRNGGRLYSAGVSAQIALADQWSAVASGRFDSGWIAPTPGAFATLTGYGLSLLFRYQH